MYTNRQSDTSLLQIEEVSHEFMFHVLVRESTFSPNVHRDIWEMGGGNCHLSYEARGEDRI